MNTGTIVSSAQFNSTSSFTRSTATKSNTKIQSIYSSTKSLRTELGNRFLRA